jgi:tetratricopeptide (TPR) repeat protein
VRSSIVVAALLIVVLGAYASALDVPFFWDDRALVLDNPEVHQGASLGHYFSRPFWPDPDEARAFFRPLVGMSFRLDFLIHGENATGFHLTNVVFHLVNTGLLYALLRRWRAGPYTAGLAAAAFALLPRLTEAVTWIAGRTDVLATTGVLAALLVWPPAEKPSAARSWMAGVVIFLALLCKEVALAGVAAIVALELVHVSDRPTKRRVLALLPMLVASAAFVVLHEHAIGANATPDGLVGVAPRLAAAGASWGTYTWMIAAPWQPSLQIGQLDHAPATAIVAGVVALALASAALVQLVRRRDAAAAAGMAMTMTALLLVSHLVSIPTNVLCSDRFLYVPAAGLAIAAAISASRLTPRAKRAAAGACAAWALSCAVATFVRNQRLGDELELWLTTAERVETTNTLPAQELANVLFRSGDYDEALSMQMAIARALEAMDRSVSAAGISISAAIATSLSSLGRYAEARVVRERIIATRPRSWRAWLELARVDLHLLEFDASRAAVERAEQLSGDARPEAGELRALIDELERLRAREGNGVASPVERARFEARAGRRAQAEKAWAAAMDQPGVDAGAVGEGAAFLAQRGSLERAPFVTARVLAEPALGPERSKIIDILEERGRFATHVNALRPRIRAVERRFP